MTIEASARPSGAGPRPRSSRARSPLRLSRRLGLGEHVNALAWWAPGGLALAATLDGRVSAISTSRDEAPRLLAEHAGGALSVDLSPKGIAASGGQDGRVRLVPLAGGGLVRELDAGVATGSWVEHVRWSPEGRVLASAAGRVVRFWRPDGTLTGELAEHPGTVIAIWWDASGRTLTSACPDGLRLLGPNRRRAMVHIPWDAAGTVLLAAESPDARYIAMAHLGGTVSVLQVNTSRSIQYGGFPGKVRRLAWSRDSRRLAVAAGDRSAAFRFSPRGPDRERARVLRGHAGRVDALAFVAAAGGELLVSGCDAGRLVLWSEARDLRRVGALDLPGSVEQVFASPDGRALGVACRGGDLHLLAVER